MKFSPEEGAEADFSVMRNSNRDQRRLVETLTICAAASG
jgi:hypothetical protein